MEYKKGSEEMEEMKDLVWELMKVSIRKEIDGIAFDMRNALELGVPEKEVNAFIVETAGELFEKYKAMDEEELSAIMDERTRREMTINIALQKLEEGEED